MKNVLSVIFISFPRILLLLCFSSDVKVKSFISRHDLKYILYFPFTFCLPYFLYISVWLHRLPLQLAFQLLLNLMPESPFHKQKPRADPGLKLIQPARTWNYGGPWHSAYVKQLRSLSKCASDLANLGQAEAVSGARQTRRQREFDKTEIWLSYQHASYIKKPADLLAECKGVLLMHCAGRIILIYLGHNAEHCFAHIQNLGTISQVVHSGSGGKTQ